MVIAKRLNGIGEYYFSQKLREIDLLNRQGKQVLNLGIGSPDLPPHPDVIQVLEEESKKNGSHAYQSYKGSPELRNAISDWYLEWYNVELDPDAEILPLIGSKEGIMHICMTFLNKGDIAFVPDPGYPTYRSAVELTGARCVSYKLSEKNNYEPDFERLSRKISGKVKLMFVNYPHMPTGRLPHWELFQKLVDFAQMHQILVVHDNPYSFILNENPMSLFSAVGARDCVIELNSLSKSHNMAGWRVGMLCGRKDFVDMVLRFKSNMDSGMFLPVQLAAARALQLKKDWYEKLNLVYRQRRELVFKLLDLLGCSYSKDQAGLFVWARTGKKFRDGYDLSDQVLNLAYVFITPGGIFGKSGIKYVRVSLCSPEEKLRQAIQRIENFKPNN